MKRTILAATRTIRRRAALAVARVYALRVHDETKLQSVQVGGLDQETLGGVERYQGYGFSSVPKVTDSLDGVAVFVGGNRSHGVIVGLEDRLLRPRSQPVGSVCLYTGSDDPEAAPDAAKARVALVDDTLIVRFDGKVDIQVGTSRILAEPSKITISAATVAIVGSSEVTIDAPTVLIQGKPDFKQHEHINGGGSGNSGPVSS